MSARLRILLLEDDPLDAELVLAALRAAGLDFDARVVQTEASFGDALTRFRPDAVVSDYSMPGFSGLAALALCRRGGADLPFIFVSGTIGEDVAVEAMKLGASDYVMKGNLLRLGPAVVREVRDARERHARRVAESGLRRAQAMAKLSHVVSGADGSFQNWSENLPAMLAAGEAEMPKSIWYWLERVHPDDRTRFRRIALEARASGEQRTLEYRLRAGDGRWIHIRQTIEPLAGEQEGPRWFNTLQDVSEEKRAEQALEESEARFRRTFDLAASGMAHVDLEGRLIRVNPKLCAMLGYAADELVGRSVKDLSHPEDRDVTDAGRERMRAAAASDGAFEKRYLRKDGSVIWVSLTVALARDSDGEPEYEIAVLEDITERRNAQARIERLTRVHAVMSGINAAIVRIRDRQKLLEEACRIAVDAGRFPMAYIALVDCERGRLVPAAWNAPTEGFLRAAEERFRLDADNPPARVARDKVPFVANDVEADPRMVLKDEHAQRGVRSVAILPILVADEVAGVLGLHATEPGFFDEAELRLLQELAGDIAFALEHMEKEEKLHYLAYYDELTGLANHALLMERLAQSLRSASHEGREVSLILIDVERFRAVNDSLGRQVGDAVLRQLARRLEDSLGQRDCVARVGGDRFAVFLTAARLGGDAARSHLERMRTCFGEPFRAGEHELRLSARAGIALFPADGGDAETLYRNAEAALASAKSSREPFSFYAQAMNERAAERLSLETRLRRAIDRQEFVLHYQPKVDLPGRRVTGVEALIRWQSAELGLVPPLRFIPLLEETGLIARVGAWALRRAASDHRGWVEKGLPAPRVAVNVSAIQLRQPDFLATLREAQRDGAVPPGIDIEITESLLMEDIERNIPRLNEVRALGVNIAIDDFGTGYSSLAYLARLPLHALKIDRSFVAGMAADPARGTLVSTIISLAHSLGLRVVAEGVETEQQAKLLGLLRCDEMQGYLISKPLPAQELEALLAPRQQLKV